MYRLQFIGYLLVHETLWRWAINDMATSGRIDGAPKKKDGSDIE